MKFFATFLWLAAAIYSANGLCNTCSATSGLACVAENKFKVCVDGLPTDPVIQCPEGTVCTPNAQVCVPAGSTPSSCARCNKCNDGKVFACTGYNAFTLCYGSGNLESTAVFECPGELVCNIDSSTICVDGGTTGLGATCPWVEPIDTTPIPEITTIKTPNPETQSNEFCRYKGIPGRYEVTTDGACQKYISCVASEENWSGNLYECPRGTYFNPDSQMCGVDKPSRCEQMAV